MAVCYERLWELLAKKDQEGKVKFTKEYHRSTGS